MIQDVVSDQAVGIVFDIQRFSIHDGPGIRTTVFLKGCPLRCLWCDNPESQEERAEIAFWNERCIRCNACLAVCPLDAITVDEDGRKRIRPDRCDLCGRCLRRCPAGALEQIGRSMTVEEVLSEIEKDRSFYEESGGGMTLSGGEPTAQSRFSERVLKCAHERGIHTAIETCGYARWNVWRSLLPQLDLILYDLKVVDSVQHKHYTGVANELILENLRKLTRTGKEIVVRRPIIPGYTDSESSMHSLGQFLERLDGVKEVHLLPYHNYGQGKYVCLGIESPLAGIPSLQEDAVIGLADILASYNIKVQIGG